MKGNKARYVKYMYMCYRASREERKLEEQMSGIPSSKLGPSAIALLLVSCCPIKHQKLANLSKPNAEQQRPRLVVTPKVTDPCVIHLQLYLWHMLGETHL